MKPSFSIPSRIRFRPPKLRGFVKCNVGPMISPTEKESPKTTEASLSPPPEPYSARLSRASPRLSPNDTIESIDVRTRRITLKTIGELGSMPPSPSSYGLNTTSSRGVLTTTVSLKNSFFKDDDFREKTELSPLLTPTSIRSDVKRRQVTLKLAKSISLSHITPKAAPPKPPSVINKGSDKETSKFKSMVKLFQTAATAKTFTKTLASLSRSPKARKTTLSERMASISPTSALSTVQGEKRYRFNFKNRQAKPDQPKTQLPETSQPATTPTSPKEDKVYWRGKFGKTKRSFKLKKVRSSKLLS